MPKSLILGPGDVLRLLAAVDEPQELVVDEHRWLCVGDRIAVKETWGDMREANEPGWPAAYRATWHEDGWATEPAWRSQATMPLWASRFSILVERVIDEGVPQRVLVRAVLTPGVGQDTPDAALDAGP